MCDSIPLRPHRGALRVCAATVLTLAAAVLSPAVADTVTPQRLAAPAAELSASEGLSGPASQKRLNPSIEALGPGVSAGSERDPVALQVASVSIAASAAQDHGARGEWLSVSALTASGAALWAMQGGVSLLLYVWSRSVRKRGRPRW